MLHSASDFRAFGGNPIKKNKVNEACSMHGGNKNVHMVLMGKVGKKKTPLGRPSGRWENDNKIYT